MAALTAQAQVRTETVAYSHQGTALEGFLAYEPGSNTKRPGVLIVHDWNSIDDYERGRARQLAELGYVAFAVDIYGREIRPQNPQESGAQARKFKADRALLRARAAAGL
ncbi:MAG TPA: dienelactone hydrolase family protein, partial [Fimbriimonadaceae bacterium]|nr:dienelactone hydrolase family protein [Fimbriimonadaceae bacterium]